MRVRALILLLLAALAVGGCGSDGDGDGATSPTAADTRITHQFGTTTVPKDPKRVAAIGFNEQDFALALGVKPVAVREFIGAFDFRTRPWAPGANSDPKPVEIGGSELDYEKLASVRPDLVLGIYSFIERADYDKLTRIAPTVAQTKDFAAGAVPWDRQLLDTGRALGREAKARDVVKSVDDQFAAAKRDNPEFAGKTVAVVFESGSDLFVLTSDDLRQQFFTDLGFRAPKPTGTGDQEGALSRERLDAIDVDAVVTITDDEKGILASSVYKRLKAVREGRVITVRADDAFAGALGYNSPLSRPFLLKQVVPQLKAALDGDPATTVPAAS